MGISGFDCLHHLPLISLPFASPPSDLSSFIDSVRPPAPLSLHDPAHRRVTVLT